MPKQGLLGANCGSWGSRGYPLVAADYSASRSQLAKTLGLGRKGATARGRGGRAEKA